MRISVRVSEHGIMHAPSELAFAADKATAKARAKTLRILELIVRPLHLALRRWLSCEHLY